MKSVLVIVVTHNGKHWLDRCLGSVSAGGVPISGTLPAKKADFDGGVPKNGTLPAVQAELYVWDNDSTDGSADFVAANYPQAHLVRSADNLGFAQPNNAGMQYALDKGYDYVYLLNQDAWLESGALEILVSASQANPEYAVLSPLQMTDGYKELDAIFKKILRFAQNDRVAEVKFVMAAHWLRGCSLCGGRMMIGVTGLGIRDTRLAWCRRPGRCMTGSIGRNLRRNS